MKQLENLRTSLQAKWAKVKGKNVKITENSRSASSSQSWVENVSEVRKNVYIFHHFHKVVLMKQRVLCRGMTARPTN